MSFRDFKLFDFEGKGSYCQADQYLNAPKKWEFDQEAKNQLRGLLGHLIFLH